MSAEEEVVEAGEAGEEEPKPFPIVVKYCKVCNLPPEYCRYGDKFDQCLPWLAANAPDVLTDEEKAGIDMEKLSVEVEEEKKPAEPEVKLLPGGKKKKVVKAAKEVIISVSTRNKKKFITTIKGLEMFDIKPKEAAKTIAKKLGTGASINGNPPALDIQGDVSYDAAEVVRDKFKVPEDAIFFLRDGEKEEAF
mmetsp:Transcript_10480/g.27441  ORF Transcript_10480/g.27441 Transcript_10480/m.27441 type:complete len:193 (-) Transcript_10480:332-910(-)